MRLFLALAVLLALPSTAAAAAPVATTGAAKSITRTSATVTGSVDPNLVATTFHFEYGTTTAYGLRTPEADAGDGDDPVAVQAALANLTAQTTYHYRIVATSTDGTALGTDRTLRTADAPRPPGVTGTRSRDVGATAATLRGLVDLNDGATRFHFEYGTSTRYGSRTPEHDLGTGDGSREVTEAIAGLTPYRRYNFRLVATNEAGTTASLNRSFVTDRLPTGVTLQLDQPRSPWGEGVEVFGQVSGTGVGGIPVGLDRQDFPYTAPFTAAGTPLPVRADSSGRFRIFVPSLFAATRLRAATRTDVVAVSEPVTANVALRVGIAARRASHKRVRLRGSVRPAAPEGRAVLQRRNSRGGWTFVRGKDPSALGSDRSRYTFVVKRRTRPRVYRVRVIARDGGAHVPGTSRKIKVKRR
jgi:hypothetical protein